MLRPFCKITIQQVTPYSFTDKDGVINVIPRNKKLDLDFVTSYEIESGWENHTDSMTIVFPKNIQLKTKDALFKESGSYNVILGGTTNQNYDGTDNTYAPLILRGDVITLSDGYWYRNQNGVDIKTPENIAFQGFISNVKSETPIEIECEDNYYLLKRVPFDKHTWNGNLYSLMNHIIDLTNEKFSDFTAYPKLSFFEVPNSINAQFSLGYLDIGDMTCAQLLERLKNQYHFESSFVGNELQFGITIYNEEKANSKNFFSFQDIFKNGLLQTSANIFPEHNLEYSNKGDIVLSTIVQCKIVTPIKGKVTKDGQQATKKLKMKVLVYWDIPTETFKFQDLSKPGTATPKNQDGGERHTCYYPVSPSEPAPTIQQLVDLGTQQLQKYYYIGFRGSFTSFGFPFVKWNDNVIILSPLFADRNGVYKVKRVVRKFSAEGNKGISQEIFVDYKQQDIINGKTIIRQIPKNTKSIFMI